MTLPPVTKNAALTQIITNVIERWKITRPREVKATLKRMNEMRRMQSRTNAMTDSGEFMLRGAIPQYIALTIGNVLDDQDWMRTEPDALDIFFYLFKDGLMNKKTKGLCAGDKL